MDAQGKLFRALETGPPEQKRCKDQHDPAAMQSPAGSAAACGSPLGTLAEHEDDLLDPAG